MKKQRTVYLSVIIFTILLTTIIGNMNLISGFATRQTTIVHMMIIVISALSYLSVRELYGSQVDLLSYTVVFIMAVCNAVSIICRSMFGHYMNNSSLFIDTIFMVIMLVFVTVFLITDIYMSQNKENR